MTDLRAAAEMALEAMERRNAVNDEYKVYLQDAIEALRQALAQPEQEPVAWEKSYDLVCALLRQAHDILATTQYPIKRPWVSLTNEECDEIWGECLGVFDCLKMTEAKLKEKNNG